MQERPRTAYPTFPASCWWPLRERFKRALPPAITAEYLQAVLEVEAKTARNLVPMLRQMGMTDERGALRERANIWRVDSEYARVCREMRDELYPAALRLAVPDPTGDFDAAVRWFMKTTGVGTAAAKRMARFYSLLSRADPDSEQRAERPAVEARAPKRKIPAGGRLRRAAASSSKVAAGTADTQASLVARLRDPDLPMPPEGISLATLATETHSGTDRPIQLVVQIMLPADATAEQIDQLVASIATHLTSSRDTRG